MIPTLLLAVAFGASALVGAEELQVSRAGNLQEPITAYQAEGRTFIAAKQAGELYGGRVYWYPVSGRVQISFSGRRLQFVAGSREAVVDGKAVALEAPVQLRASQAYIPLSFFLGEPFAALAGLESRFDEKSRLLSIERRCNLGPVRWFSYQDRTRIVIELKKALGHAAAAPGERTVDLTVPFGLVEAPEEGRVGDGFVESFSLRQEARQARLRAKLAKPGLHWRVRELSDPLRLALEVSASPPRAAAEGEGKNPVLERLPEAVAADSAAPAAVAAPSGRRRLIVIDAGHGGKDGGAGSRRGTLEKDINLQAARDLAKLLEQEEVFEVVMTRDRDAFVPLDERSRLANDKNADLFISLHCNAHRNKKEDGFEVYFVSEAASDPEAQRLAEYENSSLALEGKSPADAQAELILHALTKGESINAASELAALTARNLSGRVELKNRGVKQAAFYVLRGTNAPAILVEMGFLTNRRDEANISSRGGRRRLVDGLYAGLLDYAKRRGWLEPGSSLRSGL
ncbi:MAG: N-acetylmuramoyl-L-alanine amidase [Elusimicrobia bacterium]|nr:N-acetylmuramoyl-L-alanine amidase [Elusimicrobiota bacterium]